MFRRQIALASDCGWRTCSPFWFNSYQNSGDQTQGHSRDPYGTTVINTSLGLEWWRWAMRFAMIAPPAAAPMRIAHAAPLEILSVSPRRRSNGLTATAPRPAPMAPARSSTERSPGERLKKTSMVETSDRGISVRPFACNRSFDVCRTSITNASCPISIALPLTRVMSGRAI